MGNLYEASNGHMVARQSKVSLPWLDRWSMSCESDIVASTGFFKGRQFMGPESTSPSIEVYIAGSFSGTPIILTKTSLLGLWKKHARKGLLDSIPEYEATEDQKNNPPPRFSFQVPTSDRVFFMLYAFQNGV
ncbi:hypothetical protein ACFX2J_034344 [Malus domestica]